MSTADHLFPLLSDAAFIRLVADNRLVGVARIEVGGGLHGEMRTLVRFDLHNRTIVKQRELEGFGILLRCEAGMGRQQGERAN